MGAKTPISASGKFLLDGLYLIHSWSLKGLYFEKSWSLFAPFKDHFLVGTRVVSTADHRGVGVSQNVDNDFDHSVYIYNGLISHHLQ